MTVVYISRYSHGDATALRGACFHTLRRCATFDMLDDVLKANFSFDGHGFYDLTLLTDSGLVRTFNGRNEILLDGLGL